MGKWPVPLHLIEQIPSVDFRSFDIETEMMSGQQVEELLLTCDKLASPCLSVKVRAEEIKGLEIKISTKPSALKSSVAVLYSLDVDTACGFY